MKKYENLLDALTARQREKLAVVLSALPEKHQSILKAALEGKKQSVIAKEYGVNQSSVSRMLKRTLEAIGMYIGGQ